MTSFTIADLAEAFSDEPKELRNLVEFCYGVLANESSRALEIKKALPKDYLRSRARSIYEYAGTDNELKALWKALWSVYVVHSKENPALIPPVQITPLGERGAVISETMPCLRLQGFLLQEVETTLTDTAASNRDQWLAHALLLARRVGITTMRDLEALTSISLSELVAFPDLLCLASKCPTRNVRRYWLDAVSFLHLKALQSLACNAEKKIDRARDFTAWWVRKRAKEPTLASEILPLDEALLAITFSSRPFAADHMEGLYHRLPDRSLILAVSGSQPNSPPESEHTANSRKKRQFQYKQNLQDFAKRRIGLDSRENRKLAFNKNKRSADLSVMAEIRAVLHQFKTEQPDERRGPAPYKQAEQSLITLIKRCYQDPNLSVIAAYIAIYCVDLFISGSAWKSRLAVNTILTYLSTLTNFAGEAWDDAELLSSSQENDDELDLLTEHVTAALNDITGNDKQTTITNFFGFIEYISPVRFFAEDFEYQAGYQTQARTSYISQYHFELVCSEYLDQTDSPARRQCVHLMRCAYYFGLRKGTALQLLCEDIDYQTEILYVTLRIKRKNERSIRKIPLCFMPTRQLNDLSDYLESRRKAGNEKLFDEDPFNATHLEFLSLLKKCCDDDTIVIHSLRHCAANNALFLLTACCFDDFRRRLPEALLSRHGLFSEQQINDIAHAFEREGRPLNPYFPILDALAQLLGHVSPGVTAANYLHLLDFFFFQIARSQRQAPAASFLGNLLQSNNYRFEILKEYKKLLTDEPDSVEAFLFKKAIRGHSEIERYELLHNEIATSHDRKLSFGSFLAYLDDYKNVPGSSLPEPLSSFFDKAGNLDNRFIKDITSRAYAGWVRLQDRISQTRWIQMHVKALEKFQDVLTNGIGDKRELTKCLRALNIFGFYNLEFEFSSAQPPEKYNAWKEIVQSYGHQLIQADINAKDSTAMLLKPKGYRSPLWRHLPQITALALKYAEFLNQKERPDGKDSH